MNLININFNKYSIKENKIKLDYNLKVLDFDKKESKELKRKIERIIPENDREYFKLEEFNTKKAIFEFDLNRWLKENVSDLRDTMDSCEKRVKLNRLPIVISQNIEPLKLEKIIESCFKTFILKNNELKNKLKTSVKSVVKDLSIPFFNFKYDGYDNSIKIALKPEFRANPMLFVKKDVFKKTKQKPVLKLI